LLVKKDRTGCEGNQQVERWLAVVGLAGGQTG
jgi:hypothetical protein